MVRRLKFLSYEDRELGLFSLEKALRRASSGLLIIKGGLQERWKKTSEPIMTG